MTDAASSPAPEEKPIPEAGSALVLAVHESPNIVLLDEARFERFYEAVKEETEKLVPDLTTAKGRDEIRSMAAKVTRTKVLIDNAGKALKEEAQKTVRTVDAARRNIREKLEPLAVEVRRPLTEWEERETIRIAKADGIIQGLRDDAVVTTTETAADVAARLQRMEGADLDAPTLGDRLELATELKATATTALRTALTALQRQEAEAAELEALRAEKAARDAAEAEAARAKQAKLEAYEAAKAAQRAAAEAEAKRVADEAAEALRIEAAKREAAEAAELKARQEAEDARNAEAERHRAELEAANRRAAEAEAQREREAAEARRRQEAADAEARRVQAEAEARAADQAHRGEVMGGAKAALIELGADETLARTIVLAIAAGHVPAVSIRF